MATPLPFSVPDPNLAAPSRNNTPPVGNTPPSGPRVAVKVTEFPSSDGFVEEPRLTVGVPLLTTWVMGADVLPVKLPSPP